MNLKVEEMLMVIVAFLIGWFFSTMIKGGLVEGANKIIIGGSTNTCSDLTNAQVNDAPGGCERFRFEPNWPFSALVSAVDCKGILGKSGHPCE
jgi:hypothetical protein